MRRTIIAMTALAASLCTAAPAALGARAQRLEHVDARHPDVHHHDVRAELDRPLDRLAAVRRLPTTRILRADASDVERGGVAPTTSRQHRQPEGVPR